MSRAANSVAAFLLAFLCAAAGARGDNATIPAPASSDQGAFAPALDNATQAAADKIARDRNRKAAMRKVAGASLVIILVLICFVVGVMIVSRRMRIRYLHYDRPVRFSRLWDVWWDRDRRPPPKS